jgi:hypothetical protein
MDFMEKLKQPFDLADLEFKVEVKSKDGVSGQASTYVDPRKYQERLDEVFGWDGWTVEYRSVGDQAVICRLQIIINNKTVVREEVGEFSGGGRSQFPTASAQAFKRACASLGLGRYLYFLPRMWGKLDERGYAFRPEEIEKFKSMVPAPQAAPQIKKVDQKHANAIKRIGELLEKSKEQENPFPAPKGWQSMTLDELMVLGQAIAKSLD